MTNVIGSRIKEVRKNAGYPTQSALAEALRTHYGLKTDRAMVSKWETGRQTPEMYSIKCISELCESSTDYLCGKTNRPTPVTESGPSDDELISLWSSLTPEEILRVKDFVLGLIAARKERTSHSE